VEQIPGNKEKVHGKLSGLPDNGGEGFADISGPLSAPGLIAVRGHAPVDVSGMNKFQGLIPPL